MKKTVTLPIKGMDCASCASIISRSVAKLPGVSQSDVNIATEKGTFTFEQGKISINQISDKISKLGYKLVLENVQDYSLKQEKLIRLERQRKVVLTVMPLSVITFAIMIFGIITGMPMGALNNVFGIIAAIVLLFFGQEFLKAIPRYITTHNANMDTLIGIGTVTAFVYSALNIGKSDTSYFDVVIVVIGFILFGKYLEARSKLKTGEAIEKLILLQAKTALVERNGKILEVATEMVQKNDLVIVKPGGKIPVDGIIKLGTTSINESFITGESMPIDKKVGDKVIGGTINKQGSIKFLATNVGSDTLLAHIIKMVEDAQGSKAPIERIADQISAIFVPAILLISLATLLLWYFLGYPSLALSNFVAVLVIACPCALGLATPTAIIVGVGKGAENGILIKDAESLEKLHSVTTVVMDKTGTLTKGQPEVVDFINHSKLTDKDILGIAYSLEKNSEHPLAAAVIKYALENKAPLLKITKFTNLEGQGIKGNIKDKTYFLGKSKVSVNDKYTKEGKTPVFLTSDNLLLASFYIADVLKDSAITAVNDLHSLGLRVIMLTGDNQNTGNFIGKLAGVDEVIAEVLPSQKADVIKKFKDKKEVVAMIGDGVNDAPALALADVGIAMGTGTDIAIESSNITLIHGDLAKLVKAIRLSKNTMGTIKQNLFWAFIYNIIGIPVAAGILYPMFGILLNPIFAGAAMALSSVSVVTNSLRLKSAKL